MGLVQGRTDLGLGLDLLSSVTARKQTMSLPQGLQLGRSAAGRPRCEKSMEGLSLLLLLVELRVPRVLPLPEAFEQIAILTSVMAMYTTMQPQSSMLMVLRRLPTPLVRTLRSRPILQGKLRWPLPHQWLKGTPILLQTRQPIHSPTKLVTRILFSQVTQL